AAGPDPPCKVRRLAAPPADGPGCGAGAGVADGTDGVGETDDDSCEPPQPTPSAIHVNAIAAAATSFLRMSSPRKVCGSRAGVVSRDASGPPLVLRGARRKGGATARRFDSPEKSSVPFTARYC